MKAEMFKEIADGYKQSSKEHATNVQVNYCVNDENYPNFFKYHCESKLIFAFIWMESFQSSSL